MPTVTMPDGTAVEMPDTIDADLGARLRAFHEAHTKAPPKDYDPVSPAGIPQGFHEIRTNGSPYIVHDQTISDVIKALSDLPGVGAAERLGQGATRLAGKAASGFAGLVGGPDTVRRVQDSVNNATELPPSNDPLVKGQELLGQGASAVAAPVDRLVGNLPAGPRTAIEAGEEAAPDIAAVLGARQLAPKPSTAPAIARTPAEVAQAAGYTGLRTKADLAAPGNQAITDTLIGADASIVPGQRPSIAALENGRKVGPGRVYNATEASIPHNLTQDEELRTALGNLPNQVSQLPRSPDVEALQETMLANPNFTRDELFANIREARERAKAHWKSDEPDKDALGDAYHALANAYEDFAGRQPGVDLPAWQQARVQMAKNYQAQAALQGPQGGEHFNAQMYGKIAQRNPGLLTGNSAIVGHVASGLPSSAPVGVAEIAPEVAAVTAGGLGTEALGHALGVPGGGTLGAIAGHYAGAPLIRAKLQELLRRGNPELAGQTSTNPALSYYFNQGRMPSGWNRSPVEPQISGLLPSPSMVNTGGGATTQNTLENLGLTPDVRAAGLQHPGAARLAALREQLTRPPMQEIDFQGPQNWGAPGVETKPPIGETKPATSETIPFADVLEQGGNQRKPIAGIDPRARVAPQSPNGPNMRTPSGAPTLTDRFPTGPSDAQIAERNRQAAARLRKVAGDLSMEGPGGSSGSPLDRLRAALLRRERGYAAGGEVVDFAKRGVDTLLGRIQAAFDNPYTADWGRLRQDISKYWTTASPLAQSAAETAPPAALAAPKEDSLEDITRQLHELLGSSSTTYAEGGAVVPALAQKVAELVAKAKAWLSPAARVAESARLPDEEHFDLMRRFRDPSGNQLSLDEMNRLIGGLSQSPPEGALISRTPPLTDAQVGGLLDPPQGLADGGSVGEDTQSSIRRLADAARALDNPSGTDPNAENRARAATNLASLVYGLDAQGQPALGGRAWTQSQGGTPAGVLDAMTAIPHNLIQLGALVDKYLPGKSNPQFWSSIDPAWSQQASQRLSQLRQRLQQSARVAPASSLTDSTIDAMTDPAMLAPMGAAKVGVEGSALRKALNWGEGGTEDPTHAAQQVN